ncbi:protein of unknown function [Petrocella atlantisensis]|uniref:Uncharacterized protein n=1 Tax=Petrocella atlantisensis TaxID=2173034 RepID=A0A3P7PF57_9FIRM|nr:protein of unknown function [Petrocella atlantisensis]
MNFSSKKVEKTLGSSKYAFSVDKLFYLRITSCVFYFSYVTFYYTSASICALVFIITNVNPVYLVFSLFC